MFLFNLIHICFVWFFLFVFQETRWNSSPRNDAWSHDVICESRKKQEDVWSKKKEKEKKKLETCSLDVENVEMEMCLEVWKERKTLEMNWTQFVNMRES